MGVSDYAKRHMEAVKKYQMKCDSITIRPPKAIGQEIRSAAKKGWEVRAEIYSRSR